MSRPASAAGKPPIGVRATLACIWEATAGKPGNVHRGADFPDLTFADFLTSAAVIGPVFDQAADRGVGELVLRGVSATHQAVGANTNLGTLLLLAPLARAEALGGRDRLGGVLAGLTQRDAELAYEAIRLAAPGGMGEVAEADIRQQPDVTLRRAMELAADRDLVARQYANGFAEVGGAADGIARRRDTGAPLSDAIVGAFLELLATRPDTLIARKCGGAVAQEAADRAAEALVSEGQDGDPRAACGELDFWLRADGARRNPGATADAVAAALFVLLGDGRLTLPIDFYGRR